jgi:hypothetical protein
VPWSAATLRLGLPPDALRLLLAAILAVSALGAEFIIPILILVFGADIRTAGMASVLISVPVVLTGVGRHKLWTKSGQKNQTDPLPSMTGLVAKIVAIFAGTASCLVRLKADAPLLKP